MISLSLRKRVVLLRKRLYVYPPPQPMPRKRMFWIAMGLVTVAVAIFSVYFILYTTGRQDAFLTHAEDFGIHDQAIWNTVHGHILHQTICNIVGDSNCYSANGIMRFAIHVEPILLPISLLYLLWPDPKVLLIVQTLVVASGAYPAFWLARLRLRNDLAGVAIALLYLLYPAQQQATVFDFHAVTFTAALLFFALYFLYTRQTVWTFVFLLLAMACKEEVSLLVVMIGLWSALFQQRWRTGLVLVLIASIWFATVYLYIMPHFSPTGHPLLASRFQGLGKGPIQIIGNIVRHPVYFVRQYVLEPKHHYYLETLLSPAGYLPLLTPWVLVMALPIVLLNLLSSDVQMYTGLFQYNAEIVPVLVFATIEAIVLILWCVQGMGTRLKAMGEGEHPSFALYQRLPGLSRVSGRMVHYGLLVLLLLFILFKTVRVDYGFHGQMPFAQNFQWPTQTAHTALAQRFMRQIPENASASVQTQLVPHLSHREHIYMFPYQDMTADYILLDVTGDVYPFFSSIDYIREVKTVLLSGEYGIMDAGEGYLLLRRGLPGPDLLHGLPVKLAPDFDKSQVPLDLPDNFCTNAYVTSPHIANPLQATFTGAGGRLDFMGYDVERSDAYLRVTTYWRVPSLVRTPMQMLLLVTDAHGQEYVANNNVSTFFWCQTNKWKPDMIVQMTSQFLNLQLEGHPNGLAHLSIALLPMGQSWSTMKDVHQRLAIHLVSGPDTVKVLQQINALQLLQLAS